MIRNQLFLIVISVMIFFTANAQDASSPIGKEQSLVKLSPKIPVAILRRLNEIGIETYFSEMQKNGISSQSFGLSAKGALLYNYELGIGKGYDYYSDRPSEVRKRPIKGIADMDATGRAVGGQLLPYEVNLTFGPDRKKRVSISAFAFRDMVDFERIYGGVQSGGDFSAPQSGGFWAYMNKLEFFTLTWDENYTFDNLKTFDFKFIELEPKLAILSGKRYVFNLVGSTDIGSIRSTYTLDDGTEVDVVKPDTYITDNGWTRNVSGLTDKHYYAPHKATQFQWNYTVGLGYKQKLNNGDILSAQTNWRAGIHRAWFNDPDIVKKNTAAKMQNDIKNQYGDWTYPTNIVSANRHYGYVTTHFSYSKLLNKKQVEPVYFTDPNSVKKRPVRLGFDLEWNLYIKDGFNTPPPSMTYDFNKNNRRMMVGKIYLKF